MAAPQVSVNLIRAFDGPRHKKLERAWTYFMEFLCPEATLHVYDNPGGRDSHAHCLNRIWEQEARRPTRYAILTEFDFLPSPLFFTDLDWVDELHPVAAAEYVTRDPYTRQLQHHGIPGAWYILVDKKRCPDLDFSPAGRFNDPANGLAEFISAKYSLGTKLLPTEDNDNGGYSIRIPQGEHLFFSRHYNDPPGNFVAGFCLWDIQKKTDAAIDRYIREDL